MTPTEFAKIVDRGKIAPVYAFIGSESALRDDALGRLEGKLLSPPVRDFNKDIVEAKPGDGETILGLARSSPVGADRRLVIVRGADALNKRDWEVLSPVITAPPPSACLVFIMEKPPPGLPASGVVDFSSPGPSDLAEFLRGEAAARGKKISRDAADILRGMEWGSLQELRQEVEKVCLYVGDRGTIDREDVLTVCCGREEVGVFALTDSLGRRDARGALTVLRDLLEGGENEIRLLSLLMGHFRRLAVVKDILGRGGSPQAVKEALGGKSYPVQKFADQAERFTPGDLLDVFGRLSEADEGLRGGHIPPRLVLEGLVLDISGYP